MLDSDALQNLASVVAAGNRGLSLSLHGCAGDSPLGQLATQICGVCEGKVSLEHEVSLERGQADGCNVTPALGIRGDGCGEVFWTFVPKGKYVRPFVRCFELMCRNEPAPVQNQPIEEMPTRTRLTVLTVTVLTAQGCPHCPHAVTSAVQVAAVNPTVRVEVVDIGVHEEVAAELGVRSVPLTVINGGWSIVGIPTVEELAKQIDHCAHAGFDDDVFNSMMACGRLQAAKELLLQKGPVPFVHAWPQSTTADRMGLLLVAEEVLHANPRALDDVVLDLMMLLDADNAAMRGDTVDLLGQIGDPRARPAVEKLLDDPNPDVAEIAKEVFEALPD